VLANPLSTSQSATESPSTESEETESWQKFVTVYFSHPEIVCLILLIIAKFVVMLFLFCFLLNWI
jgi:hypothetical protein